MQLRQNFPKFGDPLERLKTSPQDLGSRFSVSLASQEPADPGHHPDRLPKRRGRPGRLGILGVVDAQGLPLRLFEKNRTRGVGDLPSQLRQMEEAPRHHQVDRQTGFKTVIVAQLAVFDAAAGPRGVR